MSKLKEFLKEYEDARWMKNNSEQRFLFETYDERLQFLMRLNVVDFKAEYYCYQDNSGFKVEVFLED